MMDLKKLSQLTYNKEDGKQEPSSSKVVVKGSSVKSTQAKSIKTSQEATEYYKGKYVADAKLIFVISGGTNRERDYFLQFDKSHTNQNVKLIFASKEGQGLTPTQMVAVLNAAVEDSQFWDYKNREYYFGGDDEVFMIQDMDMFHNEILDAKQVCQEEIPDLPVYWMVSNPCFELWLYYHFFESPAQLTCLEYTPIEHRSQELKKLLPTLKAGGLQASKCFPLLNDAIRNSLTNYREQPDGLPELFSTNMHVMGQHILDSMPVPFDAIVKHVTEKASRFINQLKHVTSPIK